VRRSGPLAVTVAILTSVAWGVAIAPQPEAASLTLRPSTRARALRPGEAVLLTVRPSRPVAAVDGDAFGRPLTFWRDDDARAWRALLGIPVDTVPGLHQVILRATSEDGAAGSGRVSLRVARTRFTTRRLRVDESFVSPPADVAERMARESRELADVLSSPASVRLWRGPFGRPVPGRTTSPFGRLSILNGEPRGRHPGVDLQAAEGTPVRAPNAGTVALAAEHYVAGNVVVLDHGAGVVSLFAHLSRIAVRAGSQVSRGDLLGEAGATGRVTGPHLHWGVRLGGVNVDPLSLLVALEQLTEEEGR
jgi:murein DD-endopeptidase MepM/ murein hydrolase activator NlpD